MKIESEILRSRIDLRVGAKEWLNTQNWRHPFAATLTLKQRLPHIGVPIDPIIASRNVRHFANVLSRRCIGSASKRHGRRLPMFVVLEGDGSKRIHVHALIDCANGELVSSFPALVQEAWARTDWGYREVDVRPCDQGWGGYLLKLRDKLDFGGCLDWQNCHSTEQ